MEHAVSVPVCKFMKQQTAQLISSVTLHATYIQLWHVVHVMSAADVFPVAVLATALSSMLSKYSPKQSQQHTQQKLSQQQKAWQQQQQQRTAAANAADKQQQQLGGRKYVSAADSLVIVGQQ